MSEQKNPKGIVVIVSGPSGVGKSTICRGVIKHIRNAYLSVSVTTRPKAESEVNGQDYWFISRQQFQDRIHNGALLEHAEVFGNLYGTPKDKIDQALQQGRTVILEIDVEGAKQAKAKYPQAEMIFILPPTQKELARRMNARAREDHKTVEKRLDRADEEIAAAWQYYNHMIINDDLKQAVEEMVQIVRKAKGVTNDRRTQEHRFNQQSRR